MLRDVKVLILYAFLIRDELGSALPAGGKAISSVSTFSLILCDVFSPQRCSLGPLS